MRAAPSRSPEATYDDEDDDDPPSHASAPGGVPRWRLPLALFLATVASVWHAGSSYVAASRGQPSALDALADGWQYAVPLLAILVCHELGHYVAARLHGVPATLPFFIPAPIVSYFGTMGAVIRMRGRIRSRDALLDVGAAGPLAGLAIALPVLIIGLATSPVERPTGFVIQEGQSLLYWALKRAVLGPLPEGADVSLNAVAFAGWVGLFVTALNLLPIGQLDGGHIAYALLGPRQNLVSRGIHLGLLGMFLLNLWWFVTPVVRDGLAGEHLAMAIGNSIFWLFWFGLLWAMRRASGGDHPPTDDEHLSPVRRVIAVLSLTLFFLLFMPTPWSTRFVPE